MPKDAAAHDPAAVIATHALRALAVMAAFENARAELAQMPKLLADAVLCCSLQRAPAAVEAALLCLARCCASAQLQEALLQRGVLGHVVPHLLSYDATHSSEEQATAGGVTAGALPPADDATAVLHLPLARHSAQATKNLHAQLAVRALAALAGYGPTSGSSAAAGDGEAAEPVPPAAPATPPCEPAQRALAALLTETLAPRLGEADPVPLLHDLNSTVQTPQVCHRPCLIALPAFLLSDAVLPPSYRLPAAFLSRSCRPRVANARSFGTTVCAASFWSFWSSSARQPPAPRPPAATAQSRHRGRVRPDSPTRWLGEGCGRTVCT